MRDNRPHELYKITIEWCNSEEITTRYIFGIDNVPAARERAIEDCDIWPCFVTVCEWTGKRWWPIDRLSVNGGCMWWDHKKENQLPL